MKNKQDEVLALTAGVWNAFLDIKDGMCPTDKKDFNFHINALQNILFTQKYKIEVEKNQNNNKK